MTLIPTVRVLDVQNPARGRDRQGPSGDVSLTLDLTPEDAQNLIFAEQNANIWIGLLPPGEDPHGYPPEAAFGAASSGRRPP